MGRIKKLFHSLFHRNRFNVLQMSGYMKCDYNRKTMRGCRIIELRDAVDRIGILLCNLTQLRRKTDCFAFEKRKLTLERRQTNAHRVIITFW